MKRLITTDIDATLKLISRWPIRYRNECSRILNMRTQLLPLLTTDKQRRTHTKLGDKVYRRLKAIEPSMENYWNSHISTVRNPITSSDLSRIGRGR